MIEYSLQKDGINAMSKVMEFDFGGFFPTVGAKKARREKVGSQELPMVAKLQQEEMVRPNSVKKL